MSSIPSYSVTIQDSQAQRIKVLEAENRQLRHQIAWDDKLFANPHLSASHKLALRATVSQIRKVQKSGSGGELTKIFIPSLANAIGLSAKSTGKNLRYLSDAGAIIRKAETITDNNGERKTHIYIGLTDQVKSPESIQPPTPRNHGGKREHCPSCGSEQLIEEKKIICTDCGHVITHIRRPVNPEATDEQNDQRPSSPDGSTDEQNESRNTREEEITTVSPKAVCSDSPQTSIPKDTSPFIKPKPKVILGSGGKHKKPTKDACSSFTGGIDLNVEVGTLQTHATHLLLDLSGDGNEHIVMGKGEMKYFTVHSPLSLSDVHAHLAGTKTIGATLARRDGTTRALCFDADDEQTWQRLHEASKLLIDKGFKPILELSPAGRGGHLWLIFNDLVNARQAYFNVCEIAPELKEIKEYWPRSGNQKVRLPAGRYISAALTAWCSLISHTGAESTGEDRSLIIRTLIEHQTPAGLIPHVPVSDFQTPHQLNRDERSVTKPDTAGIDEYHKQKYKNNSFWFTWTPAQLASWYNERYPVTDLLPPERSGYGLAHWRGERTASVAYTKDGIGWVDFGIGARRSNDKCDGGDSLEIAARIEQRPMPDLMREAASLLLKEARAALESAAAAGLEPPAWLIPFMTPAGWTHYLQCLEKAENTTVEGDQGRRVVGFLPVQEAPSPPPQRPCICCNAMSWVWTGDRYICSSPNHPPET